MNSEQREFILAHSMTLSIIDLAEQLKIEPSVITKFYKEENLAHTRKHLSPAEQKYLKNFSTSKSIKQLSIEMKRSPGTISNFFKSRKIDYKNQHSTFNEFYFNKLDSPRKAYFLGLLYADGYILQPSKSKKSSAALGISLNSEDGHVIKILKAELKATHPINTYQHNSSYGSMNTYDRLICYSNQIVEDLNNLGMWAEKTNNLLFPTINQVPDDLMPHFIRGYFDGDGSLSYWTPPNHSKSDYHKFSLNFTGTLEMMEGLQTFFGTSVKLAQRHPKRNVNNYTLLYCGNQQIEKFLKMLYKDSDIYMERKYQIFELLLKCNES